MNNSFTNTNWCKAYIYLLIFKITLDKSGGGRIIYTMNEITTKTKKFTLYLDDNTRRTLQEFKAKYGVAYSETIRRAVNAYKLEDKG